MAKFTVAVSELPDGTVLRLSHNITGSSPRESWYVLGLWEFELDEDPIEDGEGRWFYHYKEIYSHLEKELALEAYNEHLKDLKDRT